jgi:hypothetical protein
MFLEMRLFLSILLLAAIGTTYYLVEARVSAELNVTASSFEFPQTNPQKRQLKPLAAYQSITDSPLFDEDRKPPEVVVVQQEIKPKAVTKELMVQAIGIAVAGETLLAVVKELRSGAILRLKLNDDVDGWALTSVSTSEFVFTKDDVRKIVEFKNNGE